MSEQLFSGSTNVGEFQFYVLLNCVFYEQKLRTRDEEQLTTPETFRCVERE